MSFRRIVLIALAATVVACLSAHTAAPAFAVPSSAQTSARQAEVDQAVASYTAAQKLYAQTQAKIEKASSRLDAAIKDEAAARERLAGLANSAYRSDDADMLSVLLGASTLQEFVSRWDLLTRIAQQDADTIATLRSSRIKAERSAADLLDLQAVQARSVDTLAAQVASARAKLADSEAALAEYNARTAASAKQGATPVAKTPTGTGAWKTGVASHYGLNFTGKGASGDTIGPYSMIVAHKTLPFGTLIEFEYNGKRAVAKVADRGPYTAGRTFDLGPGVIRVLGFSGVHEVRYRIITR